MTNDGSLKLRPCPFCGGSAIMYTTPDGMVYVGCNDDGEKCGVVSSTRGHFKDDSAAAYAWNKREEKKILLVN